MVSLGSALRSFENGGQACPVVCRLILEPFRERKAPSNAPWDLVLLSGSLLSSLVSMCAFKCWELSLVCN